MNRLQRALDTLVERVDTPAPIVLVDVMQDNIDRMQGFAAQHNLDVRPHVKTHTPTVEFSTSSVITEIRPGEYVFCDRDNTRLGACSEDQIALFVAATVVSDWVPDQVILDVGTKALGREGDLERGYGGVAGTNAVLAKLNEYHGFLALPAGEFRPGVGTVVPVVPNHVCPVVINFDELIVTDSAGTSLQRWPVDARGFLS